MSSWAEHEPQVIKVKEQGGKFKSYSLDDFVGISASREKVKQALVEHPAKFAYVASLQAGAMTLRERLEERLSLVDAQLDGEIRSAAEDVDPPVKLTESKVKAMIKTHKKHLTALEEYEAAREQEEMLKAIRDAMKHRLECLLAWAQNFRLELNTDPGGQVDRPREKRA